jgi:hypothetical protein
MQSQKSRHKHDKNKRSREKSDNQKKRKYEVPGLENNSLSEELGKPMISDSVYDSSDNSQNVKRRNDRASPKDYHNHGMYLCMCPSLRKFIGYLGLPSFLGYLKACLHVLLQEALLIFTCCCKSIRIKQDNPANQFALLLVCPQQLPRKWLLDLPERCGTPLLKLRLSLMRKPNHNIER